MKLRLERKYKKERYTIGKLYINGKPFCETLEDKDRGLKKEMPEEQLSKMKVKGETAIPSGTYNIIITYSPKYKKPMPLLLGVPAYEGVRIHSGNTHKDTEGCILVGENKEVGKVLNSRYTFNKLFIKLQAAVDRGETITLDIV
jgi:hypothetical protein